MKTDKRIIIIAVIIGIILIWYFGFRTLSISGRQILGTSSELLDESDTYANYKFSFSYDASPSGGDCNEVSSDHLEIDVSDIQAESGRAKFVDGLQEGVDFETTSNINLDGISAFANMCSDSTRSVSVEITNKKVICSISKGTLVNGIVRANIHCKFIADIYPTENGQRISGKIYGLTGGSATISFPKTGYCQQGKIKCSDNICRETCGGTECPTGQILCSDGTCKTNCEGQKPNMNILIVLLILSIITGGLYYVYKKTR